MTNTNMKLTDNERKAVFALKQACDEQDVHYESLFQLFKYTLVVHSSVKDDPKNPEQAFGQRLKMAQKRLEARNSWAEKHEIQSINAYDAILQIDKLYPGFFVNHFSTDRQGCVIVAHHHAYAPTKYVNASSENRARFLAAEQLRMDLAAADVIEARRGIAMVTITDGKLNLMRAWSYLGLCAAIAQNSNMHQQAHRIKQIYSQVPKALCHLVEPCKRVLPKQIASRVRLFKTMDDLHLEINDHQQHSSTSTLPQWLDERMRKYQDTLDNFHL